MEKLFRENGGKVTTKGMPKIRRRRKVRQYYTKPPKHRLDDMIFRVEDVYQIPSGERFRQFFHSLFTDKCLSKISDRIIIIIRDILAQHCLILGQKMMEDATPHETCKKETDGSINAHYGLHKRLKSDIGICAQTWIPLWTKLLSATSDEGKCLPQMLKKLISHGIKVKEVYADGKYSTYENIARAHIEFCVHLCYRIACSWVKSGNDSKKEIQRAYNEYRYRNDFNPNRSIEEMGYYLLLRANEIMAEATKVMTEATKYGIKEREIKTDAELEEEIDHEEGGTIPLKYPTKEEKVKNTKTTDTVTIRKGKSLKKKAESLKRKAIKIYKLLGSPIRDKAMEKNIHNPITVWEENNIRNFIESYNNLFKNNMGVDGKKKVKGWKNHEKEKFFGIVVLQMVALIRAQNGIILKNMVSLEGLT